MSRYILDCDPGHDDAVAMLLAARHLDLIGVTTVFGNSTVENTTRNALAILDAAGLSHIPVAMGAAAPLSGRVYDGEMIHGKTGLDGASFPATGRKPLPESASDFIARMADAYDDLTVIAIAPETNLAIALSEHPDIKHRIKGISVMGGSTTHGNMTPAAEFNIFADPEAANAVFASGIPITMVGLNVTATFGIDPAGIARLCASDRLIAREIGGALNYYFSRQRAVYERTYAPIHDICAVIPFSHKSNDGDLIKYEDMHVTVECTGDYTRGMTVCDRRGVVPGQGVDVEAPNARVAVSADGTRIVEVLLDTLFDFP